MRILVLVLGARVPPYPALIRTIRKTWASVPEPGVETLFYFGGEALSRTADELVLPVSDDHEHIGEKTLAALEWALESVEFDVLFRTNCSSYVDLPNLRRYAAAHAPERGFYAGFLGLHDGVAFASGSGYFLGRDLVELVVADRERWRHDLLDDAALALLLARHGVSPTPAPRVDYASARDVVGIDLTRHHFRCRTFSRGRREDRRIMRRLHRAFAGARGDARGARRHLLAR